jgi:hypothetical protein
MSLADLKKSNANNGKKKKFTVDEFIDDAENYAKGMPEIVTTGKDNKLAVQKAVGLAKKAKAQKKATQKKLYRHATFTFNEQTFKQLNYLAKESKLAKSHILRILIAEFAELDDDEKLKMLLESKVE